MFEKEIELRNAEVVTYLPERGDVLFWHGRLLHRGSTPNVEGMIRKSLIAHYSGIDHREDMPPAIQYGEGWYFPVDDPNRGEM
jgi:ectoine hydroxylase-related dioxygenase (phytanoyl-CoA dioxygenase family)